MNLSQFVNHSLIKRLIKFSFKFLSDKQVIKIQYRAVLKRKPNLNKPSRFTEKIQWYKLNYRKPLMTQCVDKYKVRDYIKSKGHEDTLVTLYQVCDSFEDINFEELPNSFVIKSNNGSGTNLLIKNKELIDKKEIKRTINKWKTVNTILMGREWAYKDVPHKIVIEEMLIDQTNIDGQINDYKFLCFDGKVKYIWVDTDRHIEHKRNFYDLDWNLLNVESDCFLTQKEIPKPVGYDYMLDLAESISKDFPFARVDFYSVNGKVYFGEITFYPWSGCVQFTPDEFDFEMGKLFSIPK